MKVEVAVPNSPSGLCGRQATLAEEEEVFGNPLAMMSLVHSLSSDHVSRFGLAVRR